MRDGRLEMRLLWRRSALDLADGGIVGVHGKMAFKKQEFLWRRKRRSNSRSSDVRKNPADQAVPHPPHPPDLTGDPTLREKPVTILNGEATPKPAALTTSSMRQKLTEHFGKTGLLALAGRFSGIFAAKFRKHLNVCRNRDQMADSRDLSSALKDLPSKSDLGQTTLKKIAWRLLPLFALGYGVAIMDRNNIGFAALQMNRDLHFSASIYGFGAGLFSIGYALCEIPSNLMLYRFGARRWISRIMLTWGLLAMGMMFVKTPPQFYAMRFILGMTEAGFFPGIVFYLLQWFPDNLRSRAISRFYCAAPLAAIANGLLAGPLMSLQGGLGLRGWQWLFLLEGLPAVLLSVVFLLQLPNTPDEARWLLSSERAWLKTRLAEDIRTDTHLEDTWGSLRDKRIWMLGLLNFCAQTCIIAYTLTTPTILREATGFSIASIGVLTAINGLLGVLSVTINATHSDHTRERRWHIVIPLL